MSDVPTKQPRGLVLLDGTLAECDRVGDGRADYSAKHRRHGVNVQGVTYPSGRLLWLSPALPGRALTRAVVPESRATTARRPDPVGQVLVIALLAVLTYTIIQAPDHGWASPVTLTPPPSGRPAASSEWP